MEATENDLCAFIDWLDDQKLTDKAASAMRGLALSMIDDLRSGSAATPKVREVFGPLGGIKGIANDPQAAKAALSTTMLQTFFDGNGRKFGEWLAETGRHDCAPLCLRYDQFGRGRAKPMQYWLERLPEIRPGETGEPRLSEPEDPPATSHDEDLAAEVISYTMAYCQDADLTAWGRFIFRDGRLIRSNWRWRLLPIRLIAMLLGVGAMFVVTVLQSFFGSTVLVQATLVLEVLALTAFAAISLRAWVHAIHDRLRPAPDELLAIGEPAEIEILGSGPSAEWRLVRYTATCAVCAGEIRVQPGEPDFPRRMVGRCHQSPREHVFSFDRITLLGGPLIVPPRIKNKPAKGNSPQAS